MLAGLAICCGIMKMSSQYSHPGSPVPDWSPQSVQSEQSGYVEFDIVDQFRLGKFSELMNSRQVALGCSWRGETNGKKPRQDRSSDRD